MKSYTGRVLTVLLAVSLVTNVLLYFRYSSSRPLVTVGSAVITKKQFQDQLEHDDGQPILTKLVYTSLVTQAAARAGVTPTDADIADRMQAIERQAPQVLAPYGRDPAKLAQFRQGLATSMALESLRIQDVALTPAQISEFYERHKTSFGLPQQTLTTTVVTQNAVDAATAAELLRQNNPPDVIGRQPRLRVVGIGGYSPDLQALPPALKQQTSDWAQTAAMGAVKTFQAGGYYLTFRVSGKRPSVIPPLSEVRGAVERAARLEIAPSEPEEMARLYQKTKPSFNSDKYAAYFSSIEQYPVRAGGAKKTAAIH